MAVLVSRTWPAHHGQNGLQLGCESWSVYFWSLNLWNLCLLQKTTWPNMASVRRSLASGKTFIVFLHIKICMDFGLRMSDHPVTLIVPLLPLIRWLFNSYPREPPMSYCVDSTGRSKTNRWVTLHLVVNSSKIIMATKYNLGFKHSSQTSLSIYISTYNV